MNGGFWCLVVLGFSGRWLLPVGADEAMDSERPLFRVIYDMELAYHDRRLTANLAVNKLDADRFSIKCRKTPGGTLFTYWATPEQDYLLFPRADMAFVGSAGRPFGLFPGGPHLTRTEWLELLLEPSPRSLGAFRFLYDGSWRVLTDPESGTTFRWREKKRIYKSQYKASILEPRRKEGVTTHPLTEFTTYWEHHDFR